ncbi:MAG: aspartate kinase [Firmicutes bacterium]|nr:aspartate kinase [Bacillota bacterium]
MKVLKFGGSSVADAQQFVKIKDIVFSDPERTAVVVSAPGKRFDKDNKVTDLLYLCCAHIKYDVDYTEVLANIKARYYQIANELGIDFDLDSEFAEIQRAIDEDEEDEDYIVSRGEYITAKMMACYLGYEFIDAYGHVFFNYDMSIDSEQTYESLKLAVDAAGGKVVMPGFFGTMPDGKLALMQRGGSDVSGAILAAALDADVYENWTDVPGILMADPRIVEEEFPIPEITFDELRELTYMGAKVLHESAIFPVREKGIPINIRDTNSPEEPGTMIAESFEESDASDHAFYITGVTGRKGFNILNVTYKNIGSELNILSDVLDVFQKYKIKVESTTSSVDVFSFVVSRKEIKQNIYALLAEIEDICGAGAVSVVENISLVACISRRMVGRPGVSGKIFGALGTSDINIKFALQGTQELTILLGVDDRDLNGAIKVLYNSFC